MSYDDLRIDWHLTPGGWVSGKQVPTDRVLSGQARIYQASMWAKEERSWEVTWTAADGEAVAALVAKFGKEPEHYYA